MQALRTILKEIDSAAYDLALNNNEKKFQYEQSVEDRNTLDKKWEIIENKLRKEDPSFQKPVLPYTQNILPKDYNGLYSQVYDKLMLNNAA